MPCRANVACVCVYVCLCMCACMCAYLCMYVCMCVHVCGVRVYLDVCVRVWRYLCVYRGSNNPLWALRRSCEVLTGRVVVFSVQMFLALLCYTVSLITVVITIRAGDFIQQAADVSDSELSFWRGMSHLRTAVTLGGWCLSAGVTSFVATGGSRGGGGGDVVVRENAALFPVNGGGPGGRAVVAGGESKEQGGYGVHHT